MDIENRAVLTHCRHRCSSHRKFEPPLRSDGRCRFWGKADVPTDFNGCDRMALSAPRLYAARIGGAALCSNCRTSACREVPVLAKIRCRCVRTVGSPIPSMSAASGPSRAAPNSWKAA